MQRSSKILPAPLGLRQDNGAGRDGQGRGCGGGGGGRRVSREGGRCGLDRNGKGDLEEGGRCGASQGHRCFYRELFVLQSTRVGSDGYARELFVGKAWLLDSKIYLLGAQPKHKKLWPHSLVAESFSKIAVKHRSKRYELLKISTGSIDYHTSLYGNFEKLVTDPAGGDRKAQEGASEIQHPHCTPNKRPWCADMTDTADENNSARAQISRTV